MHLPLAKGPHPAAGHRSVDQLWDRDAEKYRVCCRSVHVTKATQFIGFMQLGVIAFFLCNFIYLYVKQQAGYVEENSWLEQASPRFMTSLLTAVSLQLSLVLMMLHGVKVERRAFLLPFIIFASFAVFLALIQVSFDFVAAAHHQPGASSGVQLFSHVIGVFMHLWCVSVVWRCYCFLGDKKVAEQISQQLHATQLAFAYDFSQPPPYADTVEKHPLNMA